ncbi:Oidioi.mRNA.OKI2018_I69.chr2.g5805.t1.cds [Oikopleura dioica]|uniref:Oidioi.mRNA.OKI2018_I69.chr2.g5805.t1.cds n=1 Tax=Oikopleura dioica TaxID=34765 RepID=A0ABN7T5R2_OIKDI|nr:Oidioi.mRNA.OKI2018_I69.chr2.g5805.t1.cds [Oikopleura dioica]
MFKYLNSQREKEQTEKELTRIKKELAREKRILAAEEKLLAKLKKVEVQLELHLAEYERIPDRPWIIAPGKIETLTVLAHDKVLDVMARLEQEFDRTHDQLNAIPNDLF